MTDFKLNTRAAENPTESPAGISFDIQDANLWYTDFQALKNITNVKTAGGRKRSSN